MSVSTQSYYGSRLQHALVYGGGAIAILVLLYFLIFPMKHEVNKDISGVAWKIGNTGYEKTVQVHIEGTYKNYLFHDDVFEGQINIPGASYTKDYAWKLAPVSIHKGYGDLTWYSDADGMKTRHYGFLVTDSDMNHIALGRQSGGDTFGGVGSHIITAPASNRMDAIVKTGNYFRKSKSWIQDMDFSNAL